jgi:peptidoglycan/LPS O-acetylase OafA/YrhL
VPVDRPAARDLGLDAARTLSIALVLLSHSVLFFSVGETARLLLTLAGALGVEVFFSLSGFLIGRILLGLAERDLSGGDVANFLARRWLRTLPLYYVVLLVLLLVGWPLFPADAFLAHGFVPQGYWGLPQAWSLGVEEVFYLSFPLLLWGLVRAGGAGSRRPVARTAGALLAAGWLLRLGYYFGGNPAGSDLEWFRSNPLLRIDACAYGVLLACALQARARRVGWRPSLRLRFALFFGFAAATAVAGATVLAMYSPGVGYNSLRVLLAVYHVGLFPMLDMAALLVILALLEAWPRLTGALPAAIRFGSRTSYGVYLIHVPVFVGVAASTRDLLPAGAATFAIALVVTALLAALAHRLIEAPALAWRDRRFPAAEAGGGVISWQKRAPSSSRPRRHA